MFDAFIVLAYLGWPGLLVGGASGAVFFKRARVAWALGLAALGLVICIPLRFALAV